MSGLAGRIALICHASAGPGPAIAKRLGAAGAWVAVNFRRDLEGAKGLVDAIRSAGGRAMLVPGDVADPCQAWAVVERIDLQWGPVDLVVNGEGKESGIQSPDSRMDRTTESAPPSDIEGFQSLIQAALPALRATRGRIVLLGPDATEPVSLAAARLVVQDAPVEVRFITIRSGDAAEEVAEAVIKECNFKNVKRKTKGC